MNRKIKSISGLITNSSTQVFNLPRTDDFLKFIKDIGIKDDILIIFDKEDLIKGLEEHYSDKYYSDKYYSDEIFELLYNYLDPEIGCILGDSYGSSELIDNLVKIFKKTPREVVDFIEEDYFKPAYRKPFYSYSDDCGYPTTAKILHEAGYSSDRKNIELWK